MNDENEAILTDPPALEETAVYQFMAQEAASLLPTLRHYVQKFGLAKGYTQMRDTAEDVLQDVIVEALKEPERLAGIRVPRAWLLRIAVNVIRQRLDKPEFRHKAVPPEVAEENRLFDRLVEAGATTADKVENNLAFENMLALAPAANREILRMTFEERLSGEEIAERLGVKPSTARSRLRRALNQLRENWLAQEGEGD
jgi:RNA polymerase sigma-70 factor (ECF subfamily)